MPPKRKDRPKSSSSDAFLPEENKSKEANRSTSTSEAEDEAPTALSMANDLGKKRLAHTQTSAVSEHANETGHLPLWNQVKFIDRDPHRYTRRVKEAIQIRLHSNNINRDNGIEIPEAWMPTIRKHNSRSTTKRTREGKSSANRNNKDRNTPIPAKQRA